MLHRNKGKKTKARKIKSAKKFKKGWNIECIHTVKIFVKIVR